MGDLEVTEVQFAYGGKGMTIIKYSRKDVPDLIISYPNYASVGRSFEIDPKKLPKNFVWHSKNETAWDDELKRDKNYDGNKYGRDNLDDILGYEG